MNRHWLSNLQSSDLAFAVQKALGAPPTKIPVDNIAFVYRLLPPVVCYFVLAVLVVTPHTHVQRLAVWPLIALLALRATLSVDMSHGRPEYSSLNAMLVLVMLYVTTRSLGWSLEKEALVRRLRPKDSHPSTIMDALDLAASFRGHGWEWSRRSYIPRETRPANRIAFVFHTFLSAVAHALICGVFHRAVLSLIPDGVGTIPTGSTLFDETLAFPVRYLRASIITIFIAIAIYAGMQLVYDVCTIPAIIFLGQDPAQWPPAFDAPWCATSLNDFWGHRWHQFLRHVFLTLGYPFSLALGRTGIVIGAFLASALWHHVNLLAYDTQAEMWWMLVGFGMMGNGVLAERAFRRLTERRVGGIAGWVWTMAWLVLWGNVIFEGFARAPMHDRSSLVDSLPPIRNWVEGLAVGLDEWFHAV